LTRRANRRHKGIISEIRKFPKNASAYADECAPARSQSSGDQHEKWIVAKRAAILAHRNAQRADLVTACCIEQARQNREHGSNEEHPTASLRSVGPQVAPSAAQRFCFDVAVLNLVCFGHLTRRANQGHIGIIADIVEARAGNGGGLFRFDIVSSGRFQYVETVSSNFPQFVDRSKTV
jgi:hypothetical protein